MDRKFVLAAIGAVFAMALLVGSTEPAHAQVSVDIGIHLGSPPPLVTIPEAPVQYAPSVNGNFFFYEGAYYVYRRGAWYSARRHDGPWFVVAPEYVPRPLLAVPVRYYRVPPAEWRSWRAEAPPHWQPTYGRRWEGHHEAVHEERHEERHEPRHEEERRRTFPLYRGDQSSSSERVSGLSCRGGPCLDLEVPAVSIGWERNEERALP